MNSALFARTNGVFPYNDASTDFSAKNGLLCGASAGVITVSSSATTKAMFVCLDGMPVNRDSAFGVLGQIPPVRLMAGGTIAKGDIVCQNSDGTVITDAGSGARVTVGVALEAATIGQYIVVATWPPTYYAS